MKKCFINGIGCVSAQKTFEEDFLSSPIDYSGQSVINVQKPDYKAFIPRAMIRRMGSAVKNGMVASQLAMNDAGVDELQGIITGTGLGCTQDSEKFLNRMVENDEQYLTPTSFIQSTHNTVGGQIALHLKCMAYNVTYVNAGSSFPSALLDGLIKIQTGNDNILVGGIDELSAYTTKIYQAILHYKNPEDISDDVLKNRSKGSVPGEGASFFVLNRQSHSNTYAELVDVNYSNLLINDDLERFINKFLTRNNLSFDAIDAVILGNNGDVDFDTYYDEAEMLFSNSEKLFYKHLFGEFMASPSVAVWLAAKILKKQYIPKVLKRENSERTKPLKNVLIYTQYRGKDHSLMLLKNV